MAKNTTAGASAIATVSSSQTASMPSLERQLEEALIEKLRALKYTYREDIRDYAALKANFRRHFQALNRVTLTDGEFERLLDEIVTPDVYTASRTLREINTFTRDDGTPLNYTLVNIKDWCKNTFEVVNQLRINTESTHHRYDRLLLINGIPADQIELKTLGISPRFRGRAMQQIVDYKNDPGDGYTRTLPCFVQEPTHTSWRLVHVTFALTASSPTSTSRLRGAVLDRSAYCMPSCQPLDSTRPPSGAVWHPAAARVMELSPAA